MGEAEKKPEQKPEQKPEVMVEREGKKREGAKGGVKMDEGGKEQGGGKKEVEGGDGEKKAEGKSAEKTETPQPSPEEIVMRVFMHCEGCARAVRRSLKGIEGVEEVKTDCRSNKVVVKGKVAAADPLTVVDRVQRKSGRKVELLTPVPPKPEKAAAPKPEGIKDEPLAMAAILKVHMHCESCSLEIKRRILRMKGQLLSPFSEFIDIYDFCGQSVILVAGRVSAPPSKWKSYEPAGVQAAEPDVKNSQVTVKGVFEPAKLVEYVYKRTGKHAVVVKVGPAEKKPAEKGKEDGKEKKDGGGSEKKGGEQAEQIKVGVTAAPYASAAAKPGEVNRDPPHYYYPRYQMENAYPPQLFSDENPNACTVM